MKDDTSQFHLFEAIVLNEIKTIEVYSAGDLQKEGNNSQGSSFGRMLNYSYKNQQIHSMILLKYCFSNKDPDNNHGGLNFVNMTNSVIDNIYGSDFDNFSPSTSDNQLNQQGTTDLSARTWSGNSGFTDPQSQGLVITFGTF